VCRLRKLQFESFKSVKLHFYNHKPGKMSEPFIREDLFSEARKIAQFGYWYYSFNSGKFAFSNELKNMLEIDFERTDFTDSEVLAKMFHPDEHFKIRQIKDDVLNGRTKVINTIFNLLEDDSSSKFIEVKAKILHKNDDVILTGTALDITESYYEAGKIENEEKIYYNLFEYITDVFIVFNPKIDTEGNVVDFEFRDVNETFVQKLNIPKSQLLKKSLSDLGDEFERLRSLLKITFITGQPQQDRLFFQSFDSFYDVLIYCPTKTTIAAILRDVSLLVDADNLLHDSEKKYRELFMRMSDGVLMVDQSTGEILDTNTAACTMAGLDRSHLPKLNIYQLFPGIQLKNIDNELETPDKSDAVLLDREGREIPVEVKMSVYYWYGRKVVVLTVRNMISRIEKFESMIDSEKWYKELFKHQNNAVVVLKDYKIEFFNDNALRLFGITPETIKGKTLWELSPPIQSGSEDSRMKQIELQRKALKGHEPETEWEFFYGSKHRFISNLRLSSFEFNNYKYVVVSLWDIGLKKKAEKELKEKENRWRNALDAGNVGVWDWNLINNKIYYSDLWKKMLGYEKDEISNTVEEFEKRVHPDDVAMVFNKIELFVEQKNSIFSIIFRLRTKNGNYKWINASGILCRFTSDGRPGQFIGIHYDVTKFKITIQDLIKENQNLIEGFRNAQVGIWSLSLKNMILFAPSETLELLGFDSDKILSLKDIENLVHPDDHRKFISQFAKDKTDDHQHVSIFRIFVNDELKYFSSFAKSLYDENDHLIGFTGVFKNITMYKQEELLYKNEQVLNEQFLKNSKQTMLVYQNQELVFANDHFKDLFGYTYKELKNDQSNLLDIILPDDRERVADLYNNIFNKKKGRETTEIRILSRLKRMKWVEATFSPTRFNDHDALLILMSDITKRKNYELKLANDEFTWRTIMQKDPVGILHLDNELNVISSNYAFCQISDNHNSLKGKWNMSVTFYEHDVKSISEYLSKIADGHIEQHIGEYTLKGDIEVRLLISCIENHIKDRKEYVIYFENLDIEKKQINILSERNFTYNKIIESANAGIVLFDQNGNSIVYNKMFLLNCGIDIKQDEIINFDDLSLIRQNELLRFKELNFEEKNEMSFIHQLFPGKVLFYEIQKVDLISSYGVLLVVRDITLCYYENNQYVEQFKKYFSIFESLPYGVALIDKNRYVVTCNRAYTDIMGVEDVHNKSFKIDMLLKAKDINRLVDVSDRLFSGVTDFSLDEYEISSDREKYCYVGIKSIRFADEYGDTIYIMHVVDDRSEVKLKNKEQINSDRIRSLGLIADELMLKVYNYLILIYGSAFLLKQADSHLQPMSVVNSIFNYSGRLINSASEILVFSNHFVPMQILFNPIATIERALSSTNINNTISIEVVHDLEDVAVYGDGFMVAVALQNIIQNAVDSIPGGGKLYIKTDIVYFNIDSGKELSELKSGKYIRIGIIDNGGGIQKSHLPEKVFDPFITTKNQKNHLGIGLTIAKIIVRKNGGDVKVHSSKTGTRVNVYLPTLNVEDEDFLTKPTEISMPNGIKNILLVDDDEVVRGVIFELLQKLKFNVIAYNNGDQALRFIKENLNAVDLVFVDSGIYVSDNLKLSAAMQIISSDVKIVLMKELDDDKVKKQTDTSDFLPEIEKPINVEKIISAISAFWIGDN
jgi:PAS domain S-box-containing protein